MRKLKTRAVTATVAGVCAAVGLTLAVVPAASAAPSPRADNPSCVGGALWDEPY